MAKIFYIHVSYKVGDGYSKGVYGDTFLKWKEGQNLTQLREHLRDLFSKDCDDYGLPVIVSITEISKSLFRSLTGFD